MSTDGRGLDHLMEQNEAELGFLSAYGGVDDANASEASSILAALERFLKAGGVEGVVKNGTLSFGFGEATAHESGCKVSVNGAHLPLVASDLRGHGFAEGQLNNQRNEVSVFLTAWSVEQRRFIERLVEHSKA